MISKNNLVYLFILITVKINLIKNIILPINIELNKTFYFYTTLYYGDAKVPQTFILDTTSSIISSPCNLCTTCGYHSNEWYNITNTEKQILSCNNNKCGELSGNCEDNQCTYKYDYYEDAYIKGIYVNERICFEKNAEELFNITIGCTINETNYIIAQDSDGIMGLNNDDNSFINILYKSHIISNNLFSIFLYQNNSGYLSLGEINKQFNSTENINYVPFSIDGENYYRLQIDSFEINGKTIDNNNNYPAIIDTTATLTSFPKDLYDSIINEFDKKCREDLCGKLVKNRHFGVCAIFSDEDEMMSKIKYWLNIKINFKEYKYDWRPGNYWVNISTEHTHRACLGFESTTEDVITLGTTFMHGYDVIFDRKNSKIGFIDVNSNLNLNLNLTSDVILNNNNSNNSYFDYIEENKIKKEGGSVIKSFLIFSIFIIIIIIILFVIYTSWGKDKKITKRFRRNRVIIRYKDKERKNFLGDK